MILRDNSIVRTLTYKESMYGANISKEKAIENSDGWTCVTLSQGVIIHVPAKASCIAYYKYYILLRIMLSINLASCQLKPWRFPRGF